MKALIEKIQTIDIFSVSMKDTCELPCMKHMWHDEIWDYFDYKSIFGIDNPQIGCGYALSKETIVSILEDGNKGLDAVSERAKTLPSDMHWEEIAIEEAETMKKATERFGYTNANNTKYVVRFCKEALDTVDFHETKIVVFFNGD